MTDSPSDPRPSPSTSAGAHSDAESYTLTDPTLANNWNYESKVAQVEAIINRIEMGDLELAEVFDQFAIAVTHLHECEAFLTQKKHQMDLLIETLVDNSEAF